MPDTPRVPQRPAGRPAQDVGRSQRSHRRRVPGGAGVHVGGARAARRLGFPRGGRGRDGAPVGRAARRRHPGGAGAPRTRDARRLRAVARVAEPQAADRPRAPRRSASRRRPAAGDVRRHAAGLPGRAPDDLRPAHLRLPRPGPRARAHRVPARVQRPERDRGRPGRRRRRTRPASQGLRGAGREDRPGGARQRAQARGGWPRERSLLPGPRLHPDPDRGRRRRLGSGPGPAKCAPLRAADDAGARRGPRRKARGSQCSRPGNPHRGFHSGAAR